MPKYLRSIVKKRWDLHPSVDWLEPGELQADVMKDLGTVDGDLSIWEIGPESDINRICTALAAKRDDFGPFDYLIFDSDELPDSDFDIENSLGQTPDLGLNEFHRDIKFLTANRLPELALALSNCCKDRILPKDVKRNIVEGLTNERLNRRRYFNKRLLEKIDRL